MNFSHLQAPEVNPFGPDRAVLIDPAPASAGLQAERRAQWALVLKGASLFTAMAVKARDWAKARQGEELVTWASNNSGLDAALLRGIFGGGEVPAVDMSNRLLAACLNAGKTATDAEVAKAREVVRANKAAREAAAQARRDAERAERAAQNRAERVVRAEIRVNRDAAKELAEQARAQKKAAEEAAYAVKKAAFDAAVASEPVRALIDRWNGFEGATPEVKATAETIAAELRAAGVAVDTLSALSGQWGRIKVHTGNLTVTVFADDLRQEPSPVRRARLIDERLAAGAILVDGVILTDDGQEIAVENL